jgi:hypothetical protein
MNFQNPFSLTGKPADPPTSPVYLIRPASLSAHVSMAHHPLTLPLTTTRVPRVSGPFPPIHRRSALAMPQPTTRPGLTLCVPLVHTPLEAALDSSRLSHACHAASAGWPPPRRAASSPRQCVFRQGPPRTACPPTCLCCLTQSVPTSAAPASPMVMADHARA